MYWLFFQYYSNVKFNYQSYRLVVKKPDPKKVKKIMVGA